MGYKVLARKWRPQTFEELVGQTSCRRALTQALDHDRLHHAYLFSGSRGVGKTTIARIFAKSLNCEQGVSSKPCGHCANCQAIDSGEFVDLIEVDAASRTKVDDTRELMDNARYAPARGRYKIYLIDEVHMLSTHSFNALLKTLEEPPEHIKFLLATTDPQRLPVTVLSRCLQFHLKLLPDEAIQSHLAHIADQENASYQNEALALLARAAQGSARDALSLLDQAISYCDRDLQVTTVRELLGELDNDRIVDQLKALQQNDIDNLLAIVKDMARNGTDFYQASLQLTEAFYKLALLKNTSNGTELPFDWNTEEKQLAEQIPAETIQLYYQIAVQSRRDLPYAPSPRAGFEMLLLRLLAFQPIEPDTEQNTHSLAKQSSSQTDQLKQMTADGSATSAEGSSVHSPTTGEQHTSDAGLSNTGKTTGINETNWSEVVHQLNLTGRALQAIKHCEFKTFDQGRLQLIIANDYAALINDKQRQRIENAISEYTGQTVKVSIQTAEATDNAPTDIENKRQKERREQAKNALNHDPAFQNLTKTFNGTVKDIEPQ